MSNSGGGTDKMGNAVNAGGSSAGGQGSSWLARALLVDGVVAPVLMGVSALGTSIGIWPFTLGLLLLLGAFLLSVMGIVGALVSLYLSRKPGREGDRALALIGLALCATVTAVFLFYAVPGFKVPPIHDISTDIATPPDYSPTLQAARGSTANALERSPEVDAAQSKAYPDLVPITATATADESYQRALKVAGELGWQIVNSVPGEGRIEATSTTRWMGFKDDVVIRVRTGATGGSVLDLRSVSRVGVGDAGANAARIRAFRERFAAG